MSTRLHHLRDDASDLLREITRVLKREILPLAAGAGVEAGLALLAFSAAQLAWVDGWHWRGVLLYVFLRTPLSWAILLQTRIVAEKQDRSMEEMDRILEDMHVHLEQIASSGHVEGQAAQIVRGPDVPRDELPP